MSKKPKISVILPFFNGEKTLFTSIESILKQEFTELELILINDGSTDNSLNIANSFLDKRLKIYTTKNKGLASALNLGISLAESEIIARQDQDDISFPSRLKKQFQKFEDEKELILCGTNALISNQDGIITSQSKSASNSRDLKYLLIFKNPFFHSSVMFKKHVNGEMVQYSIDPNLQPPEDYELWTRLSKKGQVHCIKEPLIIYKIQENSLSRNQSETIFKNLKKISINMIMLDIGLSLADAEAIFNYYYDIQNSNVKKTRLIKKFMLGHINYLLNGKMNFMILSECLKVCLKIIIR